MEAATVKAYDALIRVSKMNGRKESAETTMTTDDQEAAIARAIKEAGGRRGRTFEALDQSGFTIHRSEAYRTILDRVRAGESDGIVVAYGDRLTRNWRAVGAFYDALEDAGAEVIIAGMPGVDYRTHAGRTMTGLMAVMSDAQYQTAKARGDAIAELTVARGVPNAVPYGYRRNADPSGAKVDSELDVKALVPDEQAAPVVRRIFALRLDGYKWAAIVAALNEAGVSSPRGGRWMHSTVCTLVANEVYTGVVKLGRRRVENAHEALVSRADWQRAQSTRTVVRHGRYAAGLAGGLLQCSGCGGPLGVGGHEGRLTYGCRRVAKGGRCPRPVHVTKDAADDFVEETIEIALRHGQLAAVVSSRDRERQRARVAKAKAELEAFVVTAAALDATLFKTGIDARQVKLDDEQARYDELEARAEAAASVPTLDGWRELKARNDLEGQRRVARLLIDGIVVAPPAPRSKLAPITDRFSIRWGGGGQDVSARR
jgi:DNA invertase Pin-like site-specific DNA recombinase